MFLPVQIDTMALSEEFEMTQKDVEELREAVMLQARTAIANKWRENAKRDLRKSRRQYLNSIIEGEDGRFTGTITLVGTVPNMIENGASAFDMKDGFEKSSKKKVTRGKDGELGWYLTIPFSYATPGALGESEKFTGKLPVDVHKALLKVTKTDPNASLSSGNIPEQYKIPKVRKEVSLFDGTVKKEYTNKTSQYEGLKRVQNPSGGSTVMSFRRVSNNSDDNSWIHTGIQARRLADKALSEVRMDKLVGDVIDTFLNQL